jgi:two-component system response regulator NreC
MKPTDSTESPSSSISVLLVDDHAVLRQALRLLLDARAELSVVGEAGDGRQAIELAERLRPQVVVLDVMMSELNGIEVARQLSRRAPDTRILMLSAAGSREMVVQSLRAGAIGFVIKRSDTDELLLAIKLVARGHHYFSDDLARNFDLGELMHESKSAPQANSAELLTDREHEVVQLLAEGFTTREIAEKLTLSEKTVNGHKTHAMAKLGIHGRAALVKAAIKYGITSI